MRMGFIASHPVHYFIPLYSAVSNEVEVCEVAYIRDAEAWAQGYFDAGFAQNVAWDSVLLDGYRWSDFKIPWSDN